MKSLCRTVAVLSASVALPAFAAGADELTITDPAPPLYISEWLKGEPVESFEDGRVYVVEFWATWCGPCIAGMPHISELQEQYKDDVTVIGVNIWDGDASHVPAWMEDRGEGQPSGDELMQYTVAIQEGTKMAEEWMTASGSRGIPTAFIVDRDATVAWIGHPMSMDDALAGVVAGTWDAEAAHAEREKQREVQRQAEREQEAFMARAGDALERVRATEGRDKIDAIEDVMGMDPPERFAVSYFMMGFESYMVEMDDTEGARGFLDEHKHLVWDNQNMLNSLSWQILTNPAYEGNRDADMALEIGLRAHELAEGKDGSIIDTVARAYFLKAIELQRDAVEFSDGSMRASLEDQLEIYEEAYSAQPEG
ncbi:MAG: redoxin domain-containing protein [Planctomycetota bacterium]